MALSTADVLSAVNSALRRSETSIAEELMETMEDISMDVPVEPSQTSLTVSDSTEYTAFPSLMIWPKTIWRASGNVCDQISHEEFLKLREGQSTPSEGEPTNYAMFNNNFWWYPQPDQAYTFKADIYKLHAHSGASISLDDHFYTACKYGTIWKVALKYGLPPANDYFTLFEIAKNKLSSLVIVDPAICKFQQ